ncbi:isoprenyl transferase [Candidatus Bipolaricaulota bacterium]
METLVDRVVAAGLPQHVALIMDGNGRWATARGLPRTAGHQAGARAAERLIRFAGDCLGVRHITLYAFSTENWNRPEPEVEYLMDLLQRFVDEKLREFVESGIRLHVVGEVSGLPARVEETLQRAVRETEAGDKLHLTIALNYGSRQEITRACREIASEVASGALPPSDIDERTVAKHLYLSGMPDPDLVIRTSGEMRLSNFLMWQVAYAEFHFTQTLWPDFTPAEFVQIIAEYQKRERRYGGLEGGG